MTQTKKHKTIAERVAAESPYQRAVAIWIARRVNRNPERIYGVEFDGSYTEGCPTCGGDLFTGITYYDNGQHREYDMKYMVPGQFIEECVAILEEEK
jgi:hypothetical protein